MRLVAIAIISVILFFPTFWLLSIFIGPGWGVGLAAVVMYIGFPLFALHLWRKRPPELASMEQALISGELKQAEFEVTEAVAVEEYEDEGLHFYLALGSDKTIFLSGQYLYEPVDTKSFPSTRFRIYWHESLNVTYGIECIGQPLAVSKYLPSFTLEQMEAAGAPEDRQVFNSPIADVLPSSN